MNFRKWIGLAVLLAALVIGERIYLYRPDHKYRLTVEVETPGGVRSASGVFSVHPNRAYGGSGSGPAGPRAKGDAVLVDLGNGRNLAMLLLHGINPAETDGMSYLPMRAFAAAGRRIDFRDVKRQTDSVPVAGELTPTLVTFADVANPASARAVDPANLPAAFGQGFRLRGMSLQIVPSGLWPLDFGGALGEPVTRQICGGRTIRRKRLRRSVRRGSSPCRRRMRASVRCRHSGGSSDYRTHSLDVVPAKWGRR